MTLTYNRYGKARVRVMRLNRASPRHEVRELTLEVMLEGDFARSYTEGDNSAIVATDTMKNIVNALAADHLAAETEDFAAIVGRFLVERYAQAERATVTALETRWRRLSLDGAPHEQVFTLDGNGQAFARMVTTAAGTETASGLRGYTFLKSSGNGWANFHRDAYRTLPDTDDRIVATSMDATWTWSATPASYEAANAAILDAMLRNFAGRYSRGVQDSMYRMGEAALAAVPEIATVRFAMPNKHYIPIDLTPFGRETRGDVLLPTDEPHGLIEAEIARG